jgi:hypothetical protein
VQAHRVRHRWSKRHETQSSGEQGESEEEEATIFEDLHRHAEKLHARLRKSHEKLGKLAGDRAGKAFRKVDRRSAIST